MIKAPRSNPSGPGPAPVVIHQDDALIAISKPSGLLVHRSDLDRGATDFALQQVRAITGRRVHPVHRLDRPTSGVLLFAFSPATARLLQQQFDAGTVIKTYVAVVRGWTAAAGHIDRPLKDDPKLRPAGDAGRITLRPAQTDFERLATATLPAAIETYPTARFSLLRLRPRTGRSRQLRRHLAHIAHPIIGDTSHGRGAYNRYFRQHFDCNRLLLHASALALRHPVDGRAIELTAPIDDPAMLRALRGLGLPTAPVDPVHMGKMRAMGVV